MAPDPSERAHGRAEVIEILNPEGDYVPARMQVSVVSGHRADIGLMLMDADPLKIDAIVQRLLRQSSGKNRRRNQHTSFVSITEVSEDVPTVEQYAARLEREGSKRIKPAFQAKLNAYQQRLPAMNQQRSNPDFPAFPVMTFYPMNKARHPLANWYKEPFSERSSLMAEHATSG